MLKLKMWFSEENQLKWKRLGDLKGGTKTGKQDGHMAYPQAACIDVAAYNGIDVGAGFL